MCRRFLCLSLVLASAALAQDGLPLDLRKPKQKPVQKVPGIPVHPLDKPETYAFDLGPHPEYLGPTEKELAAAKAANERTAVAAIAEYLTRLFVEDSHLDADGRLAWASSEGLTGGAGVRLKFKSEKLSAELNGRYFDSAQSGVKLTFADLIGERFTVRANVERSFLEFEDWTAKSRFDTYNLSTGLGDSTELEFDVILRQDEAVGSYRDSFRALVKHQVGKTVYRVGLDRSYNGAAFENGETNVVAGVDLPPLYLRNSSHFLKLSTSVEMMYGRSDSQAPGIRNAQTLGLNGSLGLEVGPNSKRWVVGGGVFGEQTRTGLGSDPGGQNRVTAGGAWLYGSWQIQDDRRLFANAKHSSLRTELFGGDQSVARAQFEFGLETSTRAGSRWRLGVNAGSHEAPGGEQWSSGITIGFSY